MFGQDNFGRIVSSRRVRVVEQRGHVCSWLCSGVLNSAIVGIRVESVDFFKNVSLVWVSVFGGFMYILNI